MRISDWSSDVCSSDLQADADVAAARAGLAAARLDLQYTEVKAPISGRIGRALITEGALVSTSGNVVLAIIRQLDPIYADFTQSANQQIGRASCRERVCQFVSISGVAVSYKKKT